MSEPGSKLPELLACRGRGPCRPCARRPPGRRRRAARCAAVSGSIVDAELLGLRRPATARAARARRRRSRGSASSAASGSDSCARRRQEEHRLGRAPSPYTGIRSRQPSPRSPSSGRGSITAPESRCEPGALPFSSTATGTSPRRAGRLRILGGELAEPDRRGQPGRPGADDQDADLDRLGVARLLDRLGRAPRRRDSRTGRHVSPCAAAASSTSLGTIACRSPTTPRSE